MKLDKPRQIYSSFLDNHESINQALYDGFYQYKDNPDIKKTHYFEGRYENIYLGSEQIPEIDQILAHAINVTTEITRIPKQQLTAGLWFNEMGPGHITLPHRHDDYDEQLSAVYYVNIPDNSGELILTDRHFKTTITPKQGMFVFFPPDMMHEVSKNNSQQVRLSLGINIGLIDSD